MSTIFTLFMVLIMIACFLVIVVIMAQNPKGGGLSSAFGGTSSAQFGVQRTNDFMEKSTWILGATIVVLCLFSVILTTNPQAINKKKTPAQTTQKATEKTTNTTTTTTTTTTTPEAK